MASSRYETLQVPVAGGPLTVGRWGSGPSVVVAVHGLTMTHMLFHALADQLGGEVTLVAPDLRGRGASSEVGPPYGMAAHARDVAAVVGFVSDRPTTLLGYSTGAFVAALAAELRPDLARNLVLVDGGFPPSPAPPPGRSRHQSVERVIERLGARFASAEDYLAIWRAQPGFAGWWNHYVEELFTDELTGDPPELRSSLRQDAVVADSASYVLSAEIESRLQRLDLPAVVVRAARNMENEGPPICSDARVSEWRALMPGLRDVLVPDVNHYSVMLSEGGATAVAEVVRQAGHVGSCQKFVGRAGMKREGEACTRF